MSLVFRLKTKAEVEEEIREARKGSGDALIDEICGLGDPHVELIRSQAVQEERVPPPRPMTKREEAEVEERLDTELTLQRVFGEDSVTELPKNMTQRGMFLQDQLQGLQKMFGEERGRAIYEYVYEEGPPATRSRLTISPDQEYELRRSAAVGRLPGRTRDVFSEALLKSAQRTADGNFDVDSTAAAKLLMAHLAGDKKTMREMVRGLVAA
jgi:hypothetical protein